MEAYCLKCKEKREIQNPIASFTVQGKAITKGLCPVCGSKLSKLGSTEAHNTLVKPEIRIVKQKKDDSKRELKPKQQKGKPKSYPSAKVTKSDSGNKFSNKDLVIVESPAKARTIGKFLGDRYTVVASVGHVRDLLKTQLSVDIENNFTPKYRVPNEKKELIKQIKTIATKSKKVFLATDLDREGESIAWHLLESAQIEAKKAERVVFHEITKDAIDEAFSHPRQVDMDLVNAQQARRILDRLVGYGVSPILWAKVRGGLSAGRVQSVALRLIVEREREIQDFYPIEYWVISAIFSPEDSQESYKAKLLTINGKDLDLSNEQATLEVVADIRNASYLIESIKNSQRKIKPSAPFITSTLQQEASRKLGFLTRKTMAVAQQLYEGIDIGNGGETGLITYMRTDSVHVAAQAVHEARNFILSHYGEGYLPAQAPHYRTRATNTQEAHEAIRPTAVTRTPDSIKHHLTRDQYRLYKTIWQRFVASQMSPAIAEITTVDIAGKSKQNHYLFRTSSNQSVFKGFKTLYEESFNEDQNYKEEWVDLPLDKIFTGQKQNIVDVEYLQRFTQAPPRYSEASLIQALEENKIGRPSTYSPIITTIQTRGYVTLEDKRLFPTETGFIVNDLVVQYFPSIVDIRFTSGMEEKLDEIARGQLTWVDLMQEFYGPFKLSLDHATEQMPITRIQPKKIGKSCPSCGHDLVLRNGRFGPFISCSTFPDCKYTEPWLDKIGVICPTCKTGDVIRKRTKKGRVFFGCSRYPDCQFTSWNQPVDQPCPNCGGTLVIINKRHLRCLNCSEVTSVTNKGSEET